MKVEIWISKCVRGEWKVISKKKTIYESPKHKLKKGSEILNSHYIKYKGKYQKLGNFIWRQEYDYTNARNIANNRLGWRNSINVIMPKGKIMEIVSFLFGLLTGLVVFIIVDGIWLWRSKK